MVCAAARLVLINIMRIARGEYMPKTINSEAQLTTFEAISMIMGNSIGTGIIAVPYLATRNSMLDVVWMVGLAYVVNVILPLKSSPSKLLTSCTPPLLKESSAMIR